MAGNVQVNEPLVPARFGRLRSRRRRGVRVGKVGRSICRGSIDSGAATLQKAKSMFSDL
jgi:hypothetical protein